MNSFRMFRSAIGRFLSAAFGYLTAFLLFSLMVLTCIDVAGRYLFDHPVYGGFELTGILLGLTIFFALPLASFSGENVTIDILTFKSRGVRAVQRVVIGLLGGLFLLILARQLWLFSGRLLAAGETTLQLGIPIAYVTYAMSVLMALGAVAFWLFAIRSHADEHGEYRP